MYTILVNDDNTMSVTERTRIMQRSTGFDAIRFLVNPDYKGFNMRDCTLIARYVLPVSHQLRSEKLELAAEDYNGFLQYIIPVSSKLTYEPGDITCNLTFTLVDTDDAGNPIARVRKLDNVSITVNTITDWDALIPDELLSSLDQRIIEQDKQIKQLAEIALLLDQEKADGLSYEDSELQLTSKGEPIGNKVHVSGGSGSGDPDLSDGVPIVDFSDWEPLPGEDDEDDFNDIVEF